MKKILLSSLFFVFLLFSQSNSVHAENQVNVYFFWGDGCPHCAKEDIFLDQLEKQYSNVIIHRFEVWNNADNRDLLIKTGEELDTEISGVPFTVVGDKIFVGYSESLTSKEITKRVEYCSVNLCPDSIAEIVGLPENPDSNGDPILDNPVESENISEVDVSEDKEIEVPIFGNINLSKLSLPVLTVVLGGLDGFNPCAMWTLIFLITLLLGMEDRKRMWILGSAFIAASAVVYFIFMAAWLNLLLFIGFIVWVRILIGAVALVGGGYNLREYFTNPASTCKISEGDKQQKVFEKLKNVTKQRNFLLALGGIILLAFAVNLVELFCSAGLPAVYTQVLALNNLATWQYYLYLLLYIFVFMLDDLIVFVVAMTALRVTGLTSKYTRYSHLIGGILMLLIGLALIFKPEWLLFG